MFCRLRFSDFHHNSLKDFDIVIDPDCRSSISEECTVVSSVKIIMVGLRLVME